MIAGVQLFLFKISSQAIGSDTRGLYALMAARKVRMASSNILLTRLASGTVLIFHVGSIPSK
ncbi:hypothetical protein [Pectinatus frisingensis]|uniref:hypothetical protein n=1 Tax=Pectinatus frisingensis TaxID=865 RepID=UPI003D8030F9